MINIKAKIVGYDDDSQFVKIMKYKTKNTNTAEHLCVINTLVTAILDNQPDMTMTELVKLIKQNYKKSMEDK